MTRFAQSANNANRNQCTSKRNIFADEVNITQVSNCLREQNSYIRKQIDARGNNFEPGIKNCNIVKLSMTIKCDDIH